MNRVPIRGRLASARVGFVVAVALALVAAGVQGTAYPRLGGSTVVQQAHVDETVALGGTEIIVTSITVAPELPAGEAGDPPVRGPASSVLVLVVFTQRIDSTVDRETHTCSSTLVADDGTEWPYDDTYGYQLKRPDELICGETDSSPLVPGVRREIGASFLIPARYAEQVSWRLSVDDDRYLVDVRR